MTPGHALARRHSIADYLSAATSPWGFVYVETDRFLPSPSPDLPVDASVDEQRSILREWAKQPLEELRFLRRIVERTPREGDGFSPEQAVLLKGCVVWAPFHISPQLFELYLSLAEEVAGAKLWKKVVGFRYLLQGKGEGVVKELVRSEAWVRNICRLGRRRGGKGWAFDVGVDTNRDGVEMLEVVGEMVREVRKREGGGEVRFVISKLLVFTWMLVGLFLQHSVGSAKWMCSWS